MGGIVFGLFLDVLILGLAVSKVHELLKGGDLEYIDYVLGFPLLALGIVLFYVDATAFISYINQHG